MVTKIIVCKECNEILAISNETFDGKARAIYKINCLLSVNYLTVKGYGYLIGCPNCGWFENLEHLNKNKEDTIDPIHFRLKIPNKKEKEFIEQIKLIEKLE